MTIEEVFLLFHKWWSESTPITCTFLGGGLRVRVTGRIDRIEAGSIFLHSGDETESLHLPLHSIHTFQYCEPRELGIPEGEERFAGLLIIHLQDGNVLQFAEPK
jgi:hypothetical protein